MPKDEPVGIPADFFPGKRLVVVPADRIAELEADKREILTTLAAAENREIQQGQRANVAEAENKRLREALEKYGRHTLMCFSHTAPSACTCGFREALQKKKGRVSI